MIVTPRDIVVSVFLTSCVISLVLTRTQREHIVWTEAKRLSAGAIEVVFKDITIPDAMDSFITNFLTPAFTPALGVFFFFSITFGLFKFAQISSDQTVYREP